MNKKTAIAVASSCVGIVVAMSAAVALNLGILGRTAPLQAETFATDELAPEAPTPTPTPKQFRIFPEGTEIITVYVDDPALAAPSQPQTSWSQPPTQAAPQAPAPSAPKQAAPAPTPVPPTPVPPTPVPPTPVPPTSTPVPQPTPTPAPAVTYPIYDVGGAGQVALSFNGSEIGFWGAYPNDGWQYAVEDDGPRKVKVKFRRGDEGGELEFQAELDGGQIKTEVGD